MLYVFAPGGLRSFTLPSEGSVTIGRAEEADVTVDDRSVSRLHARLHLGASLSLEDLGSANGTRLRRPRAAAETHELVESKLPAMIRVALALDEPVSLGQVTIVVRSHGSESAAPEHATQVKREARSGDVVALAPATVHVFELATRIAQGPLNVLVTGETGVGKEVVALHVHRSSKRKDGPFVDVNGASLSENLAESELFGHEKGAFTGASAAKKGFFEAAHGGTLFLDEVGEMPLSLQAKLLRVLESRKVTPVGSTRAVEVDVRVVAATHRDLPADVRAGRFRQDLYFRLNGMTLNVPPLRERREDVPELARRFAKRVADVMGIGVPTFSREAEVALIAHGYPGNVRELRNVVERACALATGPVVEREHLVFDESTSPGSDPPPGGSRSTWAPPAPSVDGGLKETLAAEEKRRILEALEASAGNQTKAADKLGMPRRTLVARLSEYGLTKPRKK